MKRVLVSGATGFFGLAVVEALLARGAEVVAFARGQGDGPRALGAQVVRGDVLDAAAVKKAASGCSGAIHCAGFVSRDPGDAEALHRSHVIGTRHFLDGCQAAGVARVVISSTSGTVASSRTPKVATEESPSPIGLVSRFPYYRAKLFAEQEALGRSAPGFAVVSVNPSLLLGPGDTRGSSNGDVRSFLEHGLPLAPAGGISFVDVRDAAIASSVALERGAPGERYLLGACNFTVLEFFERIARIASVPGPTMEAPRPLTQLMAHLPSRLAAHLPRAFVASAASLEMAQLYWYLSAAKAERELGFAPRDPSATLLATVEGITLGRALSTLPGADLLAIHDHAEPRHAGSGNGVVLRDE